MSSAVATAADGSSVTLHWVAPTSGAPVEQYLIVRDGTEVGTVAGSATTYVDVGLTPGVTYTYTVVAQANDKRSPPSAVITTTTATPSPSGLEATAATKTAVTLRWIAAGRRSDP